MSTSGSQEPLRLSRNDLYSPRVDAFLDEQASLPMNSRRQAGGVVEDTRIVSGFTGQ
jgi:hypothetical protein